MVEGRWSNYPPTTGFSLKCPVLSVILYVVTEMTDYPSSIKLRLCNIFYAIFCDVQLLLIQTMPSHSR